MYLFSLSQIAVYDYAGKPQPVKLKNNTIIVVIVLIANES